MSRVALTDEQREFGRAVAEEARRARDRARMTVRQVADLSGLSVDTLRTLESGRVASPGFAQICAVAAAVSADLTEFAAAVTTRAGTGSGGGAHLSKPSTATSETTPHSDTRHSANKSAPERAPRTPARRGRTARKDKPK